MCVCYLLLHAATFPVCQPFLARVKTENWKFRTKATSQHQFHNNGYDGDWCLLSVSWNIWEHSVPCPQSHSYWETHVSHTGLANSNAWALKHDSCCLKILMAKEEINTVSQAERIPVSMKNGKMDCLPCSMSCLTCSSSCLFHLMLLIGVLVTAHSLCPFTLGSKCSPPSMVPYGFPALWPHLWAMSLH